MPDATDDDLTTDWPMFGLRLECDAVRLRPVREADLPHLAAIHPDDDEHDPRPEVLPWQSRAEHRRRLLWQGYWRALGTWSPSSWCLDLAVELDGEVVGVQSLEGEDFPVVRTVDSHSWLVPAVRGRGVGVAMRRAVLGLAFDHLGALAAVSSARPGNAASLGVSRHLGYRDNGVGLHAAGAEAMELRHLRLTAEQWRASGQGDRVRISGVEPCLRWFGAT